MEEKVSKSNIQTQPVLLLAAIVILFLAAGGFIWYQGKQAGERTRVGMMGRVGRDFQGEREEGGSRGPRGGAGMMKQQTPPALTDAQQKELTDGVATTTTEKKFTVDGGNFYFVPGKITVNEGDKVTIAFKNDGGMHNFVLDEFAAKTDVIQTNESTMVTFTASKKGSFEYYCSVGQHRAMGMKGTLIVQ